MARGNGFAHRLYTGELSFDIVGRRRTWYTFTAVLLAVCVLAIGIRGLNLGIEFRGGADFQAPTAVTATTVDDVRAAVDELGLPNNDELTVTTIGEGNVRVQTRALNVEEVAQVKQAIADQLGITVDDVAYSLIGASWGQQVTQQALIALFVFVALVMMLIGFYFRDFKMSVAAILALFHDLIITIGIYALVGFAVTPTTMIGVLTILGYSLYDTVVVFDKIRENVVDLTKSNRTYAEQANLAVNQVLIRSVNTTIIGVLPVAALLFTGAFILQTGPLKDLGLALFVGMLAGAYSSLFIASPLLTDMRESEPEMKEHRARLERRAARSKARAVPAEAEEAVSSVPLLVADAEPSVEPESLGLVTAEKLTDRQRVQPVRHSRSDRRK
ncbi:MAG: protein translocase subunit SecF [Propionibacteriaceae bacterium]|nr:protein translocase subunit SecF [Propionibacteriaceae bacterium]